MKKNYFLLSLIVVLTFFAPAIKAQSGGCPVIITQPDELIITNITKKTYMIIRKVSYFKRDKLRYIFQKNSYKKNCIIR